VICSTLYGLDVSTTEISRILSIGERTVQTHLSNVLSKLGLTSRTQAALWAVREGLTGP
jgi:DNA-binding NarL/FixJ family response regulator